MNATIKSVSGMDTVVEFILSDGTKSTQTLAGVPVQDEAAAAAHLKKYIEAYEQGLEMEKVAKVQPVVAEGIVGKAIDLSK